MVKFVPFISLQQILKYLSVAETTKHSEIITMFFLLGKKRQGYNRNNLNSYFEMLYMNSPKLKAHFSLK